MAEHCKLEASPHPLGRVLSSRQFWDLMEHWSVPDGTALELIEFPGKLGASGKRPRFRLTTRQQRITSYLPEIDATLAAAGKDQSWLHCQAFGHRTPIEHMVSQGMSGMLDVLQMLNRMAMRTAVKGDR
jgi:hypothetical protein